jgi:hypothetical protein
MKAHLSIAAALAALAAAGAASAADIEIRHALARVIVIPEARSDVAYEIWTGRADLPRITVSRALDGGLVFDGGLSDGRLFGGGDCSRHGEGWRNAVIDVAHPPAGLRVSADDHRDVPLEDTPLIVLHTPKAVRIGAGGAVFGNIGKAESVHLSAAGCGDWTVDNVVGRLEADVAGSGDIHAAFARALVAHIGGSGDVTAAEVGDLSVETAGSGDVRVGRANGEVRASIAGSGDVSVAGGHASVLKADIAGSGDVTFGGEADRVDANVMGSGDVRVKSVRGEVHKAVMGSGEVVVGR